MSVRNSKISNARRHIVRLAKNELDGKYYPVTSYTNSDGYAIGNLFRGTLPTFAPRTYSVEVTEGVTEKVFDSTEYTTIRLVRVPDGISIGGASFVPLAFNAEGYAEETKWGRGENWQYNFPFWGQLNYFYNELQEYDGDGNALYPAPKDFELVKKSPFEVEDVTDDVLLVFIGTGVIEILCKRRLNANGHYVRGDLFHRFLTEGWQSKYGNDLIKSYYTDVVIGDRAENTIQGDEARNAALSLVAPALLENGGVDAGNTANKILEDVKVLYYTKPVKPNSSFSFDTVLSFDGTAGSLFEFENGKEIYAKNVASVLNNTSNDEPILYNVFMEFPDVDEANYLYFKFDFGNLLSLKDPNRSISSYLNQRFTGTNFSASDTHLFKISSKVLFDSVGLFDLRYYDRKLKRWMSTNICSRSYYQLLYTDNAELLDPLYIVRDVIDEDTSTLSAEGIHYNPFYDYASSTLTIPTGEHGELDIRNVELKLALKPAFMKLLENDFIICDEQAKLQYGLVAIDNSFEIEDKSVRCPEALGKKLLWLAVPPIIQHVSGTNESPSLSQFRIMDDVFGPSDLTLTYGAPLHGKYPVDIFRCLKALWIE